MIAPKSRVAERVEVDVGQPTNVVDADGRRYLACRGKLIPIELVPASDGEESPISPEAEAVLTWAGADMSTATTAPPGAPNAGTVYALAAGTEHLLSLRSGASEPDVLAYQGFGELAMQERSLTIRPTGTVVVDIDATWTSANATWGVEHELTRAVIFPAGSVTSAVVTHEGPSAPRDQKWFEAPPGTPCAGAVYVVDPGAGEIRVTGPSVEVPVAIPVRLPLTAWRGELWLMFVPAGVPGAGTAYFALQDGVGVLMPDSSGALTVPAPAARRPLFVDPAECPDAGALHVVGGTGVLIVRPGSTEAEQVSAGADLAEFWWSLPAAAGGPGAGVLFGISPGAGTVSIVGPGFSDALQLAVAAPSPYGADPPRMTLTTAPAGCPNAGAAYVLNKRDGDLTIIEVREGSQLTTRRIVLVQVNEPHRPDRITGDLWFAPSGAANAGTAFVLNWPIRGVYVVEPDADTPYMIELDGIAGDEVFIVGGSRTTS